MNSQEWKLMLTRQRGLLLVYGCVVFGDTSENVDEVLVHVFYLFKQNGLITLIKSFSYSFKTGIP